MIGVVDVENFADLVLSLQPLVCLGDWRSVSWAHWFSLRVGELSSHSEDFGVVVHTNRWEFGHLFLCYASVVAIGWFLIDMLVGGVGIGGMTSCARSGYGHCSTWQETILWPLWACCCKWTPFMMSKRVTCISGFSSIQLAPWRFALLIGCIS